MTADTKPALRPARGLRFDPSTHTYSYEGRRVPSVTEIVRPATGFFGKRDEGAAARGEAVHIACEEIDAGMYPDVDEAIAPYVDAYEKFLRETGAVILASEYRVHHVGLGFAGTVDRVIAFDDHLAIVDLKTGVLDAWMGMQLAAYGMATMIQNSGTITPDLFALQLRRDGEYRLREFKDIGGQYEGFVGLYRYWRWAQKFAQ